MLQRSHKILLLLNILYLVLVKFSQLNGSSFCLILQSTQEKNRISSEMNELRDHLDIKDRKISVLQRKVRAKIQFCCKFNNFCNFENPRLRIWRIFWKRRIIRLTLPSLGYNRWHFRKYFDWIKKQKQKNRNYCKLFQTDI